MQPVEFAEEIQRNQKNDIEMEFDAGEESDNPFEDSDDEEIKSKRQRFLDSLYQRDVLKVGSAEGDGQQAEYKTIKTRELMNPLKRGVKLTDISPIQFPKREKWDPFPFKNSDFKDNAEAPSILDNIPHVIPECLAVRQSYVTKYLRGVQRCIKENIYDYKLTPDFDPMFEHPDPDVPTLAEAIAKEKEEKMKLFRRESDRQAEKDRSLMPPPPPPSIPQTPSSDDAASPFPNGQTSTMVVSNNGAQQKDEPVTEKKFGCKVEGCTKSYKNWQGLKNHMKKEHPDVTLPSKLSHSEESILATALGGNAPPRLPPPPVNQRLPPIPTHVQQHQRPQPSQQQTIQSPTRPMTPQQAHPSQQRYEVQQQSPITPQTPQQQSHQTPQTHLQSQQPQQYHPLSQQQQQQQQQIQQIQQQPLQHPSHPQQQHLQYTHAQVPVSQAYNSYPQQIHQTQVLPHQQQQARLPAPPIQMQTTQQIYQQVPHIASPQSVPSEYASAAASPHSVISQESSTDEVIGAVTPNVMGQSSANNRRVSNKPQGGPIATKMKCSHCSKSYKTQQNLIKHMRDMHPNVSSEVEVTFTKQPPPQTQTFYLPAPSNANRQEVVYVEQQQQQMDSHHNSMQQQQHEVSKPTSMTIVRQPQQPMHMVDDHSHQHQGGPHHIQQGQIITSQSGSPIVQYQIQQVPARQHQSQPQQQSMEVDSTQTQQQQHQQQPTHQAYGPSQDVIMIDSTPPATPRNTMTPIITSVEQQQQQQQHHQPQQVYIQNGQQIIRTTPSGQQIIRQQGRNIQSYISQPVHIIQQQPFSGGNQVEKYVVFNPQQSYRPRAGQQIIRGNQQIVSSQGTYIYPVTQSNQTVTSRYYTTTAQRPINSNANAVTTNIPVSGSQTNTTIEGQQTISGETNDYYSNPPQLTPQQALPSRSHRPQQAYQVYSRRPGGPSQVKIATVPNPGQKAVKYAVQVPAGNGQTYITQQGSGGGIQYIRAANGNIQPGNPVKFITAPLKVANPQRGGQQVQQYPVAGPPGTFATRPQNYASVRQQQPNRVRIAVPNTGARRPTRPIAQQVHHQQSQSQQQQQQQQQQHGPSQDGSNINVQIQRFPGPISQPPSSSIQPSPQTQPLPPLVPPPSQPIQETARIPQPDPPPSTAATQSNPE